MTLDIFSVYHTYMNPNDQGEQSKQREIDKRRVDTEKEMYDILGEITRKNPKTLTVDDKRFLQARRSYLSRGQQDEYKDILNEKLPRPDQEEEEEVELTRSELDEKARQLGIEEPEKLPNKAAVTAAIEEAENK